MILKTSNTSKQSVNDLCSFLADYGAHLLASGATCIRLDKNICRIASSYGMKAEMTIMPRHIHITILDEQTCEIQTAIASVPDTGINFSVITELSRLSWEIADKKIDLYKAIDKYNKIIIVTGQNKLFTILLVMLANASFCRLFGGDIIAMIIVGISCFAGYYTKTWLTSRKMDVRLVFIICSMVSSVIGSTDILFAVGTTPEISLSSSVLYLVPGIPLLNSFSDMLYRRYLCSFARFTDAVILTCCISIGLYIGSLLMNTNLF